MNPHFQKLQHNNYRTSLKNANSAALLRKEMFYMKFCEKSHKFLVQASTREQNQKFTKWLHSFLVPVLKQWIHFLSDL